MVDIDRYISGCEEIDRKRNVVSRVIGTLRSLVEAIELTWNPGEELAWVEMGQMGLLRLCVCSHQSSRIMVDMKYRGDWERVSVGVDVATEIVVAVYAYLPELIDKADFHLPKAGIKEHFKKFESYAPIA